MRGIVALWIAGMVALGYVGCDSPEEGTAPLLYEKAIEPAPWDPEPVMQVSRFPGGVHITDVTPDSALVAIETLEDAINVILVENQEVSWVEVQRHLQLEPVSGQMVHLELKELQPDTTYSIMATDSSGEFRSRVTRFVTALDPSKARIVRFGATSCLGGTAFPWANLSRASDAYLDFMLFAGDTVYADYSDGIEGYRGAWKNAFAAKGLADLSSRTSLISTWDDHEIRNDWNWDLTNDVQRFEAARQAYFEAMPWRGETIYRKLSWGKTLDVLVLDGRGERRDGRYMSLEQMEWLKTNLLTSEARFKVILNSVPITDMNDLVGDFLVGDRWQGFPEQRTELLRFIEDNSIEGAFFVAGDFHYSHIAKASPPGDVGHSVVEVMAGPAGSGINPLMLTNPYPDEQFMTFVGTHNYAYFEANPATGTVLVKYIGDDGNVLAEKTLQF